MLASRSTLEEEIGFVRIIQWRVERREEKGGRGLGLGLGLGLGRREDDDAVFLRLCSFSLSPLSPPDEADPLREEGCDLPVEEVEGLLLRTYDEVSCRAKIDAGAKCSSVPQGAKTSIISG